MKYGTALRSRIALLTLGLSSPALAVDGVLEINQACAVNTGCFSGDAAGLPVTITAAGSYRMLEAVSQSDSRDHTGPLKSEREPAKHPNRPYSAGGCQVPASHSRTSFRRISS
ncbi:MAG: hypothetical protein P8M78_14920 [Myxococcota bacterium]|nr:hypothetical protein [Myxococcota bacterium]